jgi:hypothetical protein
MTMSYSSLPKLGARTPPPASAPVKSSPVGKVQPYYIRHKRSQVQAFDENIQENPLTQEQFLQCFNVDDDLIPSDIFDSRRGLSIDGFLPLANEIAQSIQEMREQPPFVYLSFLDDT